MEEKLMICEAADQTECVVDGLLCDQASPHWCGSNPYCEDAYCYRIGRDVACVPYQAEGDAQ